MKQSWTRGLSDDRTKEIRGNFKESLVMRKRLIELLQEKINDCNAQRRSKLTYENPSWVHLQADLNGYERALFDIIDLISVDKT